MRVETRRWARLGAPLRRARREYARMLGPAAERRRAAEIDALPFKLWRGRPVHAVVCCADFGCGPHVLWLEEAWLWQLLSLQRFRCPRH